MNTTHLAAAARNQLLEEGPVSRIGAACEEDARVTQERRTVVLSRVQLPLQPEDLGPRERAVELVRLLVHPVVRLERLEHPLLGEDPKPARDGVQNLSVLFEAFVKGVEREGRK